MDGLTPAISGSRLLLLDPAMGFGPSRLVMAPIGVAGARLPAGVHAVEGIVSLPASTTGTRFRSEFPLSVTSSRRPSVVVGALPTGGRATGFLVAPAAAGAGIRVDSAIAAAIGGSSSTTGRRGVFTIGAAPRDLYPDEDDDDDDYVRAIKLARLSDEVLRSKQHITAWLDLARLQTTFEVAFDADVLKSGRDLRRVLDAIGEINITAPSLPFAFELCLDRIRAIIGSEFLGKLRGALTPEDDDQFGWSALAAQSVIEGIEDLMAVLRFIHQFSNLPVCTSCPVILKQCLKVVCDLSTIIESTKFRRPQNSIRYRLLEAHALALEHTCAIAVDVYEEALQKVPEERWTQLRQQLRNRRITLFEQDTAVMEYITAIGLEDTEKVFKLVGRFYGTSKQIWTVHFS